MRRHDQPRTPLEDWIGGAAEEDLRRIDQIAQSHAGKPPDAVRAALEAAGLVIPDPALDVLTERITHLVNPPPGAVRARARARVQPAD